MIMHIVGNRPQFIKLAPISRELRKRNIEEIIIHTGQHYDTNMSDIFFEQLEIPKPIENLQIGSGTHAQMTAKAMIGIENSIEKYKPDCVVIYGDTDTTLAAGLVASKMQVPIVHIEAGVRTYNMNNPEECNRLVVDHLSTYLCTPNEVSKTNLIKEGISDEKICFSGDVMYDEFLYVLNSENLEWSQKSNLPEKYAVLTWHRQENTCSYSRMKKIIDFLNEIDYDIVFPMHPRTKKVLSEYGLDKELAKLERIHVVDPVGYFEMVYLLKNCDFVISDSGGISKETSFVDKVCIFLIDFDPWPELEKAGYICKVDVDNSDMLKRGKEVIKKIKNGEEVITCSKDFFGNGMASSKVVDVIEKCL